MWGCSCVFSAEYGERRVLGCVAVVLRGFPHFFTEKGTQA